MAKKVQEETIDEDFILASMNMTDGYPSNKKDVKAEEQSNETLEVPNEHQPALNSSEGKEEKESRKRRSKNDYESLFIRPSDIAGRQEKTIYLREDYYERINSVIQLYKNPRLSVFAYVDAVLEQHFEAHKKDIKEVYNRLYRAPYDE